MPPSRSSDALKGGEGHNRLAGSCVLMVAMTGSLTVQPLAKYQLVGAPPISATGRVQGTARVRCIGLVKHSPCCSKKLPTPNEVHLLGIDQRSSGGHTEWGRRAGRWVGGGRKAVSVVGWVLRIRDGGTKIQKMAVFSVAR